MWWGRGWGNGWCWWAGGGADSFSSVLPHPTGIMVQGAGASASLQFSSDGLHWHNYTDLVSPAKVGLPEPPGPGTHHASLWVPLSLFPRAFQSPRGAFLP